MVANADYVFIVTSINDDFSVNRIVRYMTVANEGGAKPVVILTKADLTDNVEAYIEQVKEMTKGLEETFDDIIELSKNCKFSNYEHKTEPECAVKKAVEDGVLTEKRLKLYQRLK